MKRPNSKPLLPWKVSGFAPGFFDSKFNECSYRSQILKNFVIFTLPSVCIKSYMYGIPWKSQATVFLRIRYKIRYQSLIAIFDISKYVVIFLPTLSFFSKEFIATCAKIELLEVSGLETIEFFGLRIGKWHQWRWQNLFPYPFYWYWEKFTFRIDSPKFRGLIFELKIGKWYQ